MVGSGLRDIPRDETRDVIEFINKQNAPIVSIDVPSKCDSQFGACSLDCSKNRSNYLHDSLETWIGLTSGEAKNYCGKVIIEDFGIKVDDFADTHFGELLKLMVCLNYYPRGDRPLINTTQEYVLL